jgi:ArsR family transcriptional regulator
MTMKQELDVREVGEGCSPVGALALGTGFENFVEEEERFARLCKALSHPVRVRIVRLLLSVETCVCGDLVDELPLAQSTVSQHLKVLKDAGVVEGVIEGPRVCYGANREALAEFGGLSKALL